MLCSNRLDVVFEDLKNKRTKHDVRAIVYAGEVLKVNPSSIWPRQSEEDDLRLAIIKTS